MKNILVVGSINMDLLLHTKRIPHPGETMLSEEYTFGPGGKGANQAVACALLGANTTFVCKIGSDDFGAQLKQGLINNGVDVSHVSVSPRNSGFCVIMLEDGNNRLIVHLASNLDLTREDVDAAFASGKYDGMVIQFELAEDIVIYACEKARKADIPYIVDTGPAINFPLEKIRGMEILSPNETETAALCGITPVSPEDCLQAAKLLAQRSNARHIVLKMGEKGAVHYHNGETTHYPAHKVELVDATAAGDVFTAALAVQYLTHGDMKKAIEYANIAGALTVTKAGAQGSIPTSSEVDVVLEKA